MKQRPLISIIIPAYNAESTIQRCVNSVINQTYSNLEIITVNDGSKDNTISVLHSLSSVDERIKVIDIPNGGVSNARNIGVAHSHGDYIAFVDADDWIHPTMMEKLYLLCRDHNAEIAMCSRTNVIDGNAEDIVSGPPIHFYNGAVDLNLLANQFDMNVVWNKLYKRCLFDGLQFNTQMSYSEDLYFSLAITEKTKHLVYIPDGLYYYVYNLSSASYNLSVEKLQSDIIAKTRLYEYMKSKGCSLTIPFDFLFGAYAKAYSTSGKPSVFKKQYNNFFIRNLSATSVRLKCILFFIWPKLYFIFKKRK